MAWRNYAKNENKVKMIFGVWRNCYTYCLYTGILGIMGLSGCGCKSDRMGEEILKDIAVDIYEDSEAEEVSEEKDPSEDREMIEAEKSSGAGEASEIIETTENEQLMKPQAGHVPDILHYIDAWGEWHDAIINPDVKKHDYDWNYLKNDGQNISYEGDSRYTIRKGIDVSYHQGSIDWQKVKEDGYSFAIIRVAYRGYGTAGNLNMDSQFYNYVQQAHEAGLDVGVYIFSQAINVTEAIEEAELVIRALDGLTIELPVVYDPELIRDDEARTDHVSGEQFTANTLAFCQKIQEAGYQPMIYSNMIWESELFDMELIDEYPIWYADYELVPQTPYDFTFWQYSASGQVDGISGNTDLDVQFIKK